MDLNEEKVKKFNKKLILFFEKSIKNYSIGEYFGYCAGLDILNAKVLNRERKSFYKLSSREKRKHIPKIIYLIQQSVEKYVKAYVLIFGAVNKKRLRGEDKKSINHISCRAFLYTLKQKDLDEILPDLKEFSKEILEDEPSSMLNQINLSKESQHLESLISKGPSSLRRVSVKKKLEFFEKIKRKILNNLTQKKFQKSFGEVYKPKYLGIVKIGFGTERLEHARKRLVNQINFLFLLYPLAFLTYFYEAETRYPPLSIHQRGPRDFMEKKPNIVLELDNILEKLDQVGNDFKDLCSLIKSFDKLTKKQREEKYLKIYGVSFDKKG